MKQLYIGSACLLFSFSTLYSQNPLIISRVTEEIVLDGVVDEAFWETIPPLPVVVQAPTYGAPLSVPTEFRLAYDDDYLYFSAKCFDVPDMIKSKSYKRDPDGFDQDWVSIQLDTYNDKENGLNFNTYPTAARGDFTVFNDAQPLSQDESGMPFNESWNTFWNSAVTKTEKGWFVEIRIPFTSLRFQVKDNKVKMGLILTRWSAKRSEMQIFPDIPPNWGLWSSWKPSQSQEIVFEGLEAKKPVYISPYAAAGISQHKELNELETAYDAKTDDKYGLGLDLKYGLSRNMTLDLTVNTDFAQVEADNQQVNLTRFSLFFPERRQFFLERSSIFDFNFGQNNRLFYSRRIGLEDGKQIPIIAGARVVGRMGKWDTGLMNLQTASVKNIEQATENVGVTRFRRQVINANSYVGVMTTHRVASGKYAQDHPFNFTYGVDGTIRMFKQDYLVFNWAQSFEDQLTHEPLSLNPSRFRVGWENRNFQGLNYNFTLARVGENYNPGLGFEFRENYTYVGDKIGYGIIPNKDSWLRQHQFSMNPSLYFSNASGELESSIYSLRWEGITKKGRFLNLFLNAKEDNLQESFSLSDSAEVPSGRYKYYDANLVYFGSSRSSFLPVGLAQVGSYYDGYLVSLGFMPTWVISDFVQVDGFYQYNYAKFAKRNQDFRAHLARLRIQYTANTKISMSSFLQYNSAVHSVIANLRFRLNPKEGNDFFIVYNEDFNSKREFTEPRLPFSSNRVLLLKYVHTFTL